MKENKWSMFIASLTRRSLIKLTSFALFCVLVLGGYCYMGWRQAALYRNYIEYDYQKSFSGLVSGVVSIDSVLQKGLYASSPSMIAALAGEVSRRASGAQNDLSSLPFSFTELENTAKFLSQLGDWSYHISRQMAAGNPLTEDQRIQLRSLYDISRRVSSDLVGLSSIISEGNMDAGRLLAGANDADIYRSADLGDSVKNLESEFAEFPVLIYDGPFSDHIEKREPVFLKDQPVIDPDAAAQKAAGFLGIQAALLQPMGESSGTIPAYRFLARIDGGEISISITKQGGWVLSLLDSRVPGEARLTFDQAIEKARAYLGDHGFDSMKESYYTRSGNLLYVTFFHRQGDIMCYPDLVSVCVALDNGAIHTLDASGYLMNHTRRILPDIKIPLAEAQAALNPELFVSGAELCVIPTDGLNESLCYGFNCIDPEGQTYLFYVNVQTGFEDKILILVEDDSGVLTV